MHSCMLYGSETWPVTNEKELTFQQAEMRVIRWMCGIKVTNSFFCSEFRERLGIGDMITVVQRQVKVVWTCFRKG